MEYLWIALAVCAGLTLALLSLTRPKAASTPHEQTMKEKERPLGVWPPVDYQYPPIAPSHDNLSSAPIPYRPFRHASYPINMGIRPMPTHEWIQLDDQYHEYLNVRRKRTFEKGRIVATTMEGFHDHAFECLVELCSFLSTRYPSLFSVTRCQYTETNESTWGDSIAGKEAGKVTGVKNSASGEEWIWEEEQKRGGNEWNPMRIAGLLCPDDLALMIEDSNGDYVFRAGSITTAGSWRLEDKIGRSLDAIHSEGHGVVGWKDKLKNSMERFFIRLKVDKPVERNNYTFQTCSSLPWAASNGPEDVYDAAHGRPEPNSLPSSSDPFWTPHGPVQDISEIWFRTERQTLRRLPRFGAILFTIKSQMVPVTEMSEELGVPGRLASAVRAWPADVARYKSAHNYLDVLLPFLDLKHAEQLAAGLIELDEDGAVQGARRYPY